MRLTHHFNCPPSHVRVIFCNIGGLSPITFHIKQSNFACQHRGANGFPFVKAHRLRGGLFVKLPIKIGVLSLFPFLQESR